MMIDREAVAEAAYSTMRSLLLSRYELGRRLNIPYGRTTSFLKWIKKQAKPSLYDRRQRLSREFLASSRLRGTVPQGDGAWFFHPQSLPGVAEVTAVCREIFERKRPKVEDFRKKKRYLNDILTEDDLINHRDLVEFALSRPMLEIATDYLGELPLLKTVALWWTAPNDTVETSQQFHFDHADSRQLKFFISVLETREENGPFTFIPADPSERYRNETRCYNGYISDDDVYSRVSADLVQRVVGGPGESAAVDTSRCLHYGSRRSKRDRLVLLIQYVSSTPTVQGNRATEKDLRCVWN
jgi:hypothetical protein